MADGDAAVTGNPSLTASQARSLFSRRTGTSLPNFDGLTDEQLEELLNMGKYSVPMYGMEETGDEVPPWVYATGGAGLLAAIAFVALGRKKKKNKA